MKIASLLLAAGLALCAAAPAVAAAADAAAAVAAASYRAQPIPLAVLFPAGSAAEYVLQ